jgi:hypothetical protein
MTDTPRQTDILSPWVNTEWFDELSRERGTETHTICGRIARGVWVPRHDLYQGYIDSFRDWFKTMVQEALYVEGWAKIKGVWKYVGPLISRVFGFHGTPDFIGKLIGQIALAIADWKTSIAKQKVWQLQCSGAYRILAEENGYRPIGQCLSVRLDKDGGIAKGESYGELSDTKYFLDALGLWRYFNV